MFNNLLPQMAPQPQMAMVPQLIQTATGQQIVYAQAPQQVNTLVLALALTLNLTLTLALTLTLPSLRWP